MGHPPRPHRAGIATLPGQESALESGRHRAANRTRIRTRIGGTDTPGIRNGSPVRDGKAAPHPGAARPKPTAKRKTPRTPRHPERLPAPSPAPGSLALAAQKRERQVLCSAVRIAGYCFFGLAGIGICRWTFPVFGSTVSLCSFGFFEKRKFRSTNWTMG